ncbi:MAG: transporter ATP-binding protein, partial [Alphaproteobacteria bacterium]|nr:transporter ATP-binding protein [Alphaproteobacteria bacterium]
MREALGLIYQPLQHEDKMEAPDLVAQHGAITFAHVDFAYPNGHKVFNDLSLEIPAGQKIGLVGFSGSGKSTLVHLLLRHYDIQAGSIAIDGQDIAEVKLDSLRRAIAVVPQDPNLFHRSLYDNIAYGREDADETAVLDAATRAEASEFIEALSETYETKVGERGIKLSGGQRQRIAIARAILSQAPILILDEATSALDSVTESLIQKVLRQAMQYRTTIVIAHRLATLKNLDRLIVLDQGRIVENGRLEELIAANGHFARLWQMQAGGFLPE